jgi:hypothetical protein
LFNASVSQGEARLPVLVLTDETFASIHLQYAAAQQATQADSELQAFVEAFMVPPSSDAETVPCQSLLVAMLNAPRWQTEILCSGPKGKPYVVQASCVFLRYRGKAYDFSGPLHKLAAIRNILRGEECEESVVPGSVSLEVRTWDETTNLVVRIDGHGVFVVAAADEADDTLSGVPILRLGEPPPAQAEAQSEKTEGEKP